MHNLSLFTDGSVNTKTRVGFGAFLAVSDTDLTLPDLSARVKVKQFENTSSTKLELQTLLWAANEILSLNKEKPIQLIIYSDSQNIVGLPERRNSLEQLNYYARNGKILNNADLYQDFFKLMDQFHFKIIKVAGHKPQQLKNNMDKVFSFVDKAARFALRKFNSQQTNNCFYE